MRRIELSGRRFGRLLVSHYAGNDRVGHATWLCQCDCGTTSTVQSSNLIKGWTQSCGCMRRELSKNKALRHGHAGRVCSRGYGATPEYKAFINAKGRCENPRRRDYPNWGGRGIKFLYSTFELFLADVGLHPGTGYSLDRINNDSHYMQGNCCWATRQEQARNRRGVGNGKIEKLNQQIEAWQRFAVQMLQFVNYLAYRCQSAESINAPQNHGS